MNETSPALPDLDDLRASGAARFDAVGWHYIETLAQRTREQSGPAQQKLRLKLQEACQRLQARLSVHAQPQAAQTITPSPMASLLQEMEVRAGASAPSSTGRWTFENPRIEQFKKQLSQISVQKQVTQAIAQAPQNAGPINSHMLVLRSLGLMRDLSPDYLNRFMAYVDTLMFLDAPEQAKTKSKKSVSAGPSER